MRPESVFLGRDPEILHQLFSFYNRPSGVVADVTCNSRKMWKGLNTEGVVFTDIDPEMQPDYVCDFRALPFASDSVSVLVFDPPHLPAAAGSKHSGQGGAASYITGYGLRNTVGGDNISAVFAPFLAEASRVLAPDGLIFCKLADFVHNHAYQWMLVDFVSAVRDIPGMTATDLRIKRDPCGGNLKSGRWKKSFHARRTHSWWIVVRKGRCEPKQDYPPQAVGTFVDASPLRSLL